MVLGPTLRDSTTIGDCFLPPTQVVLLLSLASTAFMVCSSRVFRGQEQGWIHFLCRGWHTVGFSRSIVEVELAVGSTAHPSTTGSHMGAVGSEDFVADAATRIHLATIETCALLHIE